MIAPDTEPPTPHGPAGEANAPDAATRPTGGGTARRHRVRRWAGGVAIAAVLAGLLGWRLASDDTGPAADDARAVAPFTPGAGPGAGPASGTPSSGDDGTGSDAGTGLDPAWGLPARLTLPDGMEGTLHVVVRDRALLRIDLRTGAITGTSLPQQADYLALHAFTDGTLVVADQTTLAVRRPGDPRFTAVDGLIGGYLQVLARTPGALLVNHAAPDGNELWLLGPQGEPRTVADTVPVGNDWGARGIGIRDGMLVADFAQAVGIVDPVSGRGRALIDGAVVTADDTTVVRTRCDEELRCTLRSGPYEDPDRYVVPATVMPEPVLGTELSPDGRRLLVTSYRGEVRIRVVDLHTGEHRDLSGVRGAGPLEEAARFSADSNWVLLPDGTGIDLVDVRDGRIRRLDLGAGNEVRVIDVQR